MAFNTESFQLSIQNPLETARFAVEKITDTFLGQDSKIYYKVKWQETWEPEERLMALCAPLVNEFWKEYYTRTQQQQQQQTTLTPTIALEQAVSQSKQTAITPSSQFIQPSHATFSHNRQENANSSTPLHQIPTMPTAEGDEIHPSSHAAVGASFHISESQNSQNIHRDIPPLQEIGFKERSNLTKHMIIHTGARPHSCDVCNAKFRQLGHLIKHLLVHKPDKPYKCNVCGKGFKRKEHLKDHVIVHSNEFPYECEVCEKKFRFKTNLKVHILQHNGRKDFICDICNKAFTGKANLVQHKLVHEAEFNFACDVCDKKFRRKGHLKRHKDVHKNDRLLMCVLCKESFPNKPAYRKHLLTHTGSKPFVCSTCDKRFTSKSYLTQHMLTHTEDLLFQCEICSKKFRTKLFLEKHHASHTSEKRFSCSKCERRFCHAMNFKKHEIICSGPKVTKKGKFIKILPPNDNTITMEKNCTTGDSDITNVSEDGTLLLQTSIEQSIPTSKSISVPDHALLTPLKHLTGEDIVEVSHEPISNSNLIVEKAVDDSQNLFMKTSDKVISLININENHPVEFESLVLPSAECT